MFSSSLRVCLVFISVFTVTDGFLSYILGRCDFNSTELKDIEYIYSGYYNQVELYRFSSTVNKFIGYTEYGIKQAEYFNGPEILPQFINDKQRYCKHNIDNWQENILTKSVEPTVQLYSTTPPSGGHPAMLVCSVYDFFPKRITVSWRRDGQEVTSDVTSTDELEDGDWFYQVHSHLEYTPRSGEKISCVVEHVSLKEPKIMDWDPSMPESEKNKIAIGASGLILGLVLSVAGFIYYKRKVKGRILVPSN